MKDSHKQILIQAIKLEIELFGDSANIKKRNLFHTPKQMLECAIEFLELNDFQAAHHFIVKTKESYLDEKSIWEHTIRLIELDMRFSKEVKFC